MAISMIDTHIVVWLYANNVEKLSLKAREYIENNTLIISPIVLVELQYLFEVGKLSVLPNDILEDLNFRIGLIIEQNVPFYKIANESLKIVWTRDLFDRLIVAHTNILLCNLITKDRLIQSNCKHVIW